ncbi:hypothetical protein AWM75_02795 [Aerococcus urinaehominis]|uniref:Membrane fusion protein biotin-lipoyl like domain-containing protein n=1 Tax=Aerococcus urinaehominis TaxID=128944 RepID=A0A0X8FKY8_9LACT|nr:biotin/lipoyl-binding protein [Aerococcus urinaehominis]AMB98989.1 hypothetical protein AWM75_02795 [Aerococcus urinaehominis]SDM38163.1 hypothetical protein SAMN04487985_11435 [Aerococcus urinaehominis]
MKFERALLKRPIVVIPATVIAILAAAGLANSVLSNSSDQEAAYQVVTVAKQDPVTIDGKAGLKQDDAYYYKPERGDLAAINVSNGQKVAQGDLLFSYQNIEAQQQIEDANRQLNRLYNERARLYDQLNSGQAMASSAGTTYLAQPLSQDLAGKDGSQAPALADSPGALAGQEGVDQSGVNLLPAADEAATDPASPASGATNDAIYDQLRQVNQQIEDAEINLSRAQNNTNNLVTAERPGRVVVDEAGRTDSSRPLIRVVSEDSQVQAEAGEYDYYLLSKGQSVDLEIPANGQSTTGEISNYSKLPSQSPSLPAAGGSVAPSGGEAKFAFTVKPKEKIQPGFSVKISFPLKGFALPASALVKDKGKTFVYLYKDGQVKRQEVPTQKQGRQEVVTDQLKAGDQVVVNPEGLSDGQEIEVTDQANSAKPDQKD